MANEPITNRDRYMNYLASTVSPAQLSAFYDCYEEIDKYCQKIRILKKPLFETTDIEIIKRVQKAISQDKYFITTHKKRHSIIVSAGRHYVNYVRDVIGDSHQVETFVNNENESAIHSLANEDTELSVSMQEMPPHTIDNEVETEKQSEVTAEKSCSVEEHKKTDEERIKEFLQEETKKNKYGTTIAYIQRCLLLTGETVKRILSEAEWAEYKYGKYLYIDPSKAPKKAETTMPVRKQREDTYSVVRTDQDKRLLEKYPVIYIRVYFALNAMTKPKQKGVSIVEIYDHINRIARCSDIEDILDNVSWAHCEGKLYSFSNEIESHKIQINPDDKGHKDDNILTIDFNRLADFSYTSPISLKYFCEEIKDITSWKDLYVKLVKSLYDDYADRIPSGMSFTGSGRADFGGKDVAKDMVSPRCIFIQTYLETNLSSTDIVKKIKALLDICKVDYKKVVIKYVCKGGAKPNKPLNTKPRKTAVGGSSIGAKTVKKERHHNEQYETVLREKFIKGFRHNSSIDCKKFRKYYLDLFGKELNVEDENLAREIKQLCVVVEDRAYYPETMIGEDVKKALFSYIEESFASGKRAIYYQALFTQFSSQFLDYYIYNAEMLRAYLDFCNDGRYFVGKEQLSKEANVSTDPTEDIVACLKAYARPVTYEELYVRLPHIPQDKIRWILSKEKELIWNQYGEYFHVAAVNLTDSDLKIISGIIENSIAQSEFITGSELYSTIKTKYPDIIENNSSLSEIGFRDAVKYFLSDQFSFNSKIISAKGTNLTVERVYADFCRSKDSFTLDELNVLKNELGASLYLDAIYENSLRISKDNFVSRSYARFNKNGIDAAIDIICPEKYISLSKVDNFSVLPDAGFPWNEFLLEHYVAQFSRKYKLLSSGFNSTKCTGAIVKRNAGFNSFDELIVDVLANSEIKMEKETVLEYLCDEGYISRRKYSGIEELMIRATAQRNKKGTD